MSIIQSLKDKFLNVSLWLALHPWSSVGIGLVLGIIACAAV